MRNHLLFGRASQTCILCRRELTEQSICQSKDVCLLELEECYETLCVLVFNNFLEFAAFLGKHSLFHFLSTDFVDGDLLLLFFWEHILLHTRRFGALEDCTGDLQPFSSCRASATSHAGRTKTIFLVNGFKNPALRAGHQDTGHVHASPSEGAGRDPTRRRQESASSTTARR